MTKINQMTICIYNFHNPSYYKSLTHLYIQLQPKLYKFNQLPTLNMPKTTLQTAIAIANSSIGSAMIIFPLNYLQYGIIQNLIFLLFMGFVLATTCSVFGMHLRPSQKQITQTVKRILGQGYFKAAALMSGILVTLVSALFFLLASDILYDVLVQIFGSLSLSEKLFKIILMFAFSFLTLLNNLDFVFKAAPYAMGALIISTLAIIISFPMNFSSLDKGAIQPKELTLDGILLVASINGFAFTCHPSISPMLKENTNQKNNRKAIYLGFGISCFLYFIVGVCGSLAIYGKHPQKTSNVMDYFSGSWQAPLIGVTNFIYFLMIIPIFPFVAKNQLVSLVPQQTKQHPRFNLIVSALFAIVWLGINTFFVLSESSPGKLMGFLGSVVSFYFTYFLPGFIMLRAGKVSYLTSPKEQQKEETQKSLLNSDTIPQQRQPTVNQHTETMISNDSQSNTTIFKQVSGISQSDKQINNETIIDQGYVIKHQPLEFNDKILYGSIFCIGLILFVSQIVDTIEGF